MTESITDEGALERLQRRLVQLRRGDAMGPYAKRIVVAPLTLAEIMKAKPNQYFGASPKKAAGRAESLDRIVRFANAGLEKKIELDDVLVELGFSPQQSPVKQGLKRRVKTDIQSEEVEFRTHDDPVLKQIEERRFSGDLHPIKAGIDVWPPFCPSDDANDVRNSFAGRYMRRLLGCLSPERWHEPELTALSFSDVVNADEVRTGSLDAIFSMYDIPSRRLEGFEIIRIPGLRGALGALAIGFDRKVTWERILDRDDLGTTEGLEVFVISGEVGDAFLSGSCDYREKQIDRLERSIDSAAIAARLWREISPYIKTAPSRLTPILFCADETITREVDEELIKLAGESAESLVNHLQIIPADPLYSPYYPIGIAINGKAPRWHDILSAAVRNELFMNGGVLTAKHYLEMLARRDASSLHIVQLDPDLPWHVADRFSQHIENALKYWKGDKKRAERIEECWVKPYKAARRETDQRGPVALEDRAAAVLRPRK